MRPLLALVVLVAACAAPPEAPAPPAPPAAPPLGGLAPSEVVALRGLGIPVLVPGDPGAFTVASVEALRGDGYRDAHLVYRRADGACVEVTTTDSGVGGPDFPIVSTEARVDGLGRTVRVYEAADDPAATSAQVWGPGTVVSDVIDLDGAVGWVRSAASDGCRPVSLAEGAAVVAGLRLLPAGASASADLGPFAPAADVLRGLPRERSPEAVADALAARFRPEADRVETRVLAASATEATVLVSAFGLADDSVRDERIRLTLLPVGASWDAVGAARQVRCWPGRGHEGWGPERCV